MPKKSIRFITRNEVALLRALVCFTFLFISAQFSFFMINHQVSGMFNSLLNSPISHDIYHPIVIFPILEFITIHLMAYAMLVCWIWFIGNSIGEIFRLSHTSTFWFGICCWFMAVFLILNLNYYYFKGSFYTIQMKQIAGFSSISTACLVVPLIFLIATTIISYINYFYFRRHLITGSIILTSGCIVVLFSMYDQSNLFIVQHDAKNTKTNIIIIGIDSLRPDFTSYYGNVVNHTPNIDNFLGNATTFTNTYTPLARTFPAWISILTGKYPRHNGARNNLEDPALVESEGTLAKHLQHAGYETIYATDENRFSNIDSLYGFDHTIGPSMGIDDFILGNLSDWPLANLMMNLPISKYLFPYNYSNRANAITYDPNKFIRLVKSGLANRQDKPLFLAIHLCLTHWPFTWAQDGLANNADYTTQYRNSVKVVDTQLGQLMHLLKSDGLLEHSLVVLLSDHGTALGVPGDRFITKEKYQGDWRNADIIDISNKNPDIRFNSGVKPVENISISYGHGTDILSLKQYYVLLSFKGFGINIPKQLIHERNALIDISPTILDFLKLDPIPHSDGVSLNKFISSATHSAAQVKQSSPDTVNTNNAARPLFLETGDTSNSMETNNIKIESILKDRIDSYKINLETGLVYLEQPPEKDTIKHKQRAILWGDWLFVWYSSPYNKLSRLHADRKNDIGHYYVLANIKTGQWTLNSSSRLAKSAPLSTLIEKLKNFYGSEASGLDIKNILLNQIDK